jgi:hypothetical protein
MADDPHCVQVVFSKEKANAVVLKPQGDVLGI